MNDEIISTKLIELINEGHSISTNITRDIKINFNDSEVNEYRSIKKFQIGAENILLLRFGKNSVFYQQFMNTYKMKIPEARNMAYFVKSRIQAQTGILEAVYEAFKSGLTDDIFYQRELLVFSDMLDQAFEFLDYKLDLAAAMYGRVILEATIKEFAKKNNVNTEQKFDQIIISIRKNGIIQKPLENSLRANYEIGTWAAHGDKRFNDLTSNQVKEFLSFIRDKVLTLS